MTGQSRWLDASWPAQVVSLQLIDRTGETIVRLRTHAGERNLELELILPQDHRPPELGEQLHVTLQRGALT